VTKLVLAEVDRARYELPDELEYIPGQWGFKIVDKVEKATGLTLDRIFAGMRGIPVVTDGVEELKVDRVAIVAFAWLVVLDCGYPISWDDFDLHGVFSIATDEPEDEAEGKAPDPATSSTTTDPA
jgi:hypothetical protein